MEETASSRRVVLRGAPARPAGWRLWRALWAAGALAGYALIAFFGWPLIQGRAFDLNAAHDAGDPPMPALLQAGLAFGSFALVALVAMALCWRRRGVARVVVLLWPLLMLGVPEVARLVGGPWIWMVSLLLGVAGVAFIAGSDPVSRQEFPKP